MAILTDDEIKDAIKRGEIEINPFDEENQLQGSSYDLRLGKRGIISRAITLEELKGKIAREEVREIPIDKEESITIPGGAFALVSSLERVRLSKMHAGHIGMRTYYIRKGLALLSGLQIDPGWDAPLIFGLANLSPRGITLDYMDPLCTIEIHRLNREAHKSYEGPYMAQQREGRIPTADKDYLRTIETMSVTDLTRSLIDLSSSIENLGRWVRGFWAGIGILILLAIFSLIVQLST
ncbi:MAG: 2'-deoxycytidine 5'-triphosphate deaminase domain-containing protein [Dehalococcoidia bacterium]